MVTHGRRQPLRLPWAPSQGDGDTSLRRWLRLLAVVLIAPALVSVFLVGCAEPSAELELWGVRVAVSDPETVRQLDDLIRSVSFSPPPTGQAAPASSGLKLTVHNGGHARTLTFTDQGLVAGDGTVCADLAVAGQVFHAVGDTLLTGGGLGTLLGAADTWQVRFAGWDEAVRLAPPTAADLTEMAESLMTGSDPNYVGYGPPALGEDWATVCRIEASRGAPGGPDTLAFDCPATARNDVYLRYGPYSLDLQPYAPLLETLLAASELRPRAVLSLPGGDPVVVADVPTIRAILCGLAPYLVGYTVSGNLRDARLIAPVDLTVEIAGSTWVSCQVGPGFTVSFGGELRLPSHPIPFFVPDLAIARVLTPERVGRALAATAGLRLRADDFGLETPIDALALSRLDEALRNCEVSPAGDAYPSGWLHQFPAYEMEFDLAGCPARLALAEPGRTVLTWGPTDAVVLLDHGTVLEWAKTLLPVAEPDPSDLGSLFFCQAEVTGTGKLFVEPVTTWWRDAIVRLLREGKATEAAGEYQGQAALLFKRLDGTAVEVLVGADGFTFAGRAYAWGGILEELPRAFQVP